MPSTRSWCSLLALAVPLLAQAPPTVGAGTIGVACGRATADGRPLVWMSRDGDPGELVVMPLGDGAIPYFALATAGQPAVVFGGANVAGFAIVATTAAGETIAAEAKPGLGALLKLALQQCHTVAEFEQLLAGSAAPGRGVAANVALVDAAGGAAIFELGPERSVRVDAERAERGILVRTEAPATADGTVGRERLARAEELCRSPQAEALTQRFLLQQFLRDLKAPPSARKGERGRQDTRETLHRQSTQGALVVHGVKTGEDPGWTTMWVAMGQPLFTSALPLFPAAGALPRAVSGDPRSSIAGASARLQAEFYVAAEGENAAGLRWLRTDTMPVLRRDLMFHEAETLARLDEAMAVWRRAGAAPVPAALRAFQQAMQERVQREVTDQLERRAPGPIRR